MANWGIIGTGHIARKFAGALQASASEQCVAVASRDVERASAFAVDQGITRSYGNYAELLADPAVELVYVALPNALHAEWSIAAARAGKHVLCEKPLGRNAAEAAAMFEVARISGTWLMEAFMYRFHPQTLKVQELLRSGAIGPIKQIRASFSFYVTDPNNVRLSSDLAGGALMDVGCYCVNIARMAAGLRPSQVSAFATLAPSGVDEQLAGLIAYPGGITAQIFCGLTAARHHHVQIVGGNGIIELDEAFTVPTDKPSTIKLVRGRRMESVELISVPPTDHFVLEAEGFAKRVAAGHDAHGLLEMPLEETLDNAATIDALLASAHAGRVVAVER
jgi:D-xylose 1-dehydrogenase (NADP+, D-xylono-1,5-lactone-forming)